MSREAEAEQGESGIFCNEVIPCTGMLRTRSLKQLAKCKDNDETSTSLLDILSLAYGPFIHVH